MHDRALLEDQLRLLRTTYSAADFDSRDAGDDDDDDEPIPPKAISLVVKKLNLKLKEGIQTTMGRQAQRAVLEQLEAALIPETSAVVELAELDGQVGGGRDSGGSSGGGDLSTFPEEWVTSSGKTLGGAAGAAYTELYAQTFALERSLAASKARLRKLEGLRVPGWSDAGALAMHQGVSVQAEVNRTDRLMDALRKLQPHNT